MNENYNSKKRKKTFANDRLKKLRNTINNDSKSTSKEIQKQITAPTKDSVQNYSQEYLERKKLKATRKLKSNDNNKNSDSSTALEVKQISTQNGPNDSSDACPSKRRKTDELETSNPSTSSFNSIKNSSRNTLSHHKSLSTVNKGNNSDATSSGIKSNKTNNYSNSPLNKGSSTIDQIKQALSSKSIKKSSVSARLEVIKNPSSSNFSDICTSKQKFEYQHKPTGLETNEKSWNSSINSKNCGEYIGPALKALYNRLFRSQESHERMGHCSEGNKDSMDWEPDTDSSSNDAESCQKTKKQQMYIIVDTNIFLDSLNFLDGIVKYGSNDGIKPVIYVPWMVFNELDFIKDNRSGMKFAACKAIDFINKMLLDKEGKLIGQSIFEANKQMYVGKSPDDKIASCCLQVKEKGLNVVLLSNDKNLRNKLIINGIPSFSCNEFLSSDDVPSHKHKMNVIFEEMAKCCTGVITECCEEAYGSVWNKLALLEKQPWDFRMCLEIFKKYWVAVFKDKLLKQFLKTVETLIMVLRNSGSLKNPSSFKSFTEDCLNLCFFLMDLEQHKSIIEETATKISSIVSDKSQCK